WYYLYDLVHLPRSERIKAVLDRCILQEDHRALWCSIIPLIYIRTIEWHQVDRVILQFGGVQNCPHSALNIEFLHSRDRRGSDQWFPQTYQRWYALWPTRYGLIYGFRFTLWFPFADPGPTADFIQWWILAARRYLVPADHFHRLPPDDIPVEATQRQSATWEEDDGSDEDHRSGLAWLEDMMAEDAPAAQPTQKIRRMPETYARLRGAGKPRRGGRAGRGRGEGGGVTPTQQTQGGASTSQTVEKAGASSQAYLSSTPQTQGTTIPSSMSSLSQQAFRDGLSSLGFQHFISNVLHEGHSGYRPDMQFDGFHVHLDLNEPFSGPSHLFMALGGTPPSAAHVPGGSWDVPFMEPARLPTSPASPAPAE
ncbi:hypothetical protein PIB30_081265, partial [Stylosanthes scabra]|nr:hypothetical protein [Stylosanthes scabra]